ncbi:MAG: Cysteine synthase, partial [uncultured Solirubrobacterales bacterium]
DARALTREPAVWREVLRHRPGHRAHAARGAQAPVAQAGRADLRQARVAQPDRIGEGPCGAGHDRGRRGTRHDHARPDHPRADLGQHGHLVGHDLLAQGLPAQGRDARQRDRGARSAPAHVRRRDRLLTRFAGLERRGGHGSRHGGGRRLVLHALPVRQRGQPARPLQRHGARDPRGARRGHRLRGRARDGGDVDGPRPPPQGGGPGHEDRGRRAAPGRARAGAALARRRLHPADHRPVADRPQDLRLEPRLGDLDQAAAGRGGTLRRRLERRDRQDRRTRRLGDRRGQRRLHRLRRRLALPLLRRLHQADRRARRGDRDDGLLV